MMQKFFKYISELISNIGFIFRLMMRCAPMFFIIAATMSLFSGLGNVFQAHFLQKIIDGIIAKIPFITIFLYAVVIIVWMFLAKLQQRTLFSMNRVVTEELSVHIEHDLLEAMDNISPAVMDNPSFHNRVEQVKNQIKRIPHSIFMNLLGMIGLLASTVGFTVLLCQLRWWYVPVIVAGSGFLFIINNRYEENVLSYIFATSPERRKMAYFSSLMTQKDSYEEIHQYGAARFFRGQYLSNAKKQIAGAWKIFRQYSLIYVAAAFVSYLCCGAVYVLILWDAFTGKVTVGEVTMYLTACLSLQTMMTELIDSLCAFPPDCMVLSSYRTLLKELQMKPSTMPTANAEHAKEDMCIEFVSVSFTYPGSEKKIFDHVSFSIREGDCAAIVGVNGAGKTTLIRLLSGFYASYEGAIFIFGRELRSLSPKERQHAIAVMFQSYLKPSLPIRHAVSLRTDGDDDRIRECLAMCDYAKESLDAELTKSFDAEGILPSGGQWQRIALARMLYRDSAIYALDEPSAALDPKAEDEMFQLIATMRGKKTVLFITHRLASVRTSDTIIFIDSMGKLHQNTHAEMMKQSKEYNDLYTAQASKYVL